MKRGSGPSSLLFKYAGCHQTSGVREGQCVALTQALAGLVSKGEMM